MTKLPADFPPVVYVPTTARDGADQLAGAAGPNSELVFFFPRRHAWRPTFDGRTALFAYSAIDRLHDMYGRVPWALVAVPGLQKLYDESPYDLLFLDKRLLRADAETSETVR